MLDGQDAVADEPGSATAQPSSAAFPPHELLTSKRYLGALVLGAVIGMPVAMVAYLFLLGIGQAQQVVFTKCRPPSDPTDRRRGGRSRS